MQDTKPKLVLNHQPGCKNHSDRFYNLLPAHPVMEGIKQGVYECKVVMYCVKCDLGVWGTPDSECIDEFS